MSLSDKAQQQPRTESVRIDKWLWAARFYKTRSLAQQAIEHGRVLLDGARIKPAHPLRTGARLRIVVGETKRDVDVLGLSEQRGPAPVAQALYAETPDSIVERERARDQRRIAREPAQDIRGRPTKRDRRELERIVEHGTEP